MGCGSCGGGKPKAAKPAKEAKTSGAWKLTVDGKVLYGDTRVEVQSLNLRQYGGRGIVTRT